MRATVDAQKIDTVAIVDRDHPICVVVVNDIDADHRVVGQDHAIEAVVVVAVMTIHRVIRLAVDATDMVEKL